MLAAGFGRATPSTTDPSQVAGAGSPPVSAMPTPEPTPSPTPLAHADARADADARRPRPSRRRALVPAPLTGVLVPPAVAARHPIAVMIDDLGAARPQSGFSAASVVWQAPAEGGIPRYMMIFQENIPTDVGPVRSSRYYYIAWAAEWRAVYAHAGGSPQALQTLRQKGNGQLVYNADEFRWGEVVLAGQGSPPARTTCTRTASTSARWPRAVKAKDGPMEPAWRFAPDLRRDVPAAGRADPGLVRRTTRSPTTTTGRRTPTCAVGHRREEAARRRDRRAGRARRTSSSC